MVECVDTSCKRFFEFPSAGDPDTTDEFSLANIDRGDPGNDLLLIL